MLSDYLIIGHFNNANYTGSGNFTAFRKEAYQLLGFETRWLSPTPFIVASRFENQSVCTRACNMTVLKNLKNGMVFRVYNTHLDHISDEAKYLGIKCVFDFIDEMNTKLQMPYVLMGDFNSQPDSETIKYCNSKADIRDVTAKIPSTFHNFGKRKEPSKIDYIYMSDAIASKVTDVRVWDDVSNGIFLSDHYPVCAELEF